MVVINPEYFVFDFSVEGQDQEGNPVTPVHGNGTDKYVVSVKALSWDGSLWMKYVSANVIFSDGRPEEQLILVRGKEGSIEVSSSSAQTLCMTLEDTSSGDSYQKSVLLEFV